MYAFPTGINLIKFKTTVIRGTGRSKDMGNIQGRRKIQSEKSSIVGNSRKKIVNPTIWGNPEKRICFSKYHSNNVVGNPPERCTASAFGLSIDYQFDLPYSIKSKIWRHILCLILQNVYKNYTSILCFHRILQVIIDVSNLLINEWSLNRSS